TEAVGAVLVGADIDADDAAAPFARHQPPLRRLVPLIVEAQPVDDGLVLDKPENARLWVAGLRERRHGAYFGETEAQAQKRVRHFGILVVAGRDAHRIGKVEA